LLTIGFNTGSLVGGTLSPINMQGPKHRWRNKR
jgi:hypothetical protein